MKPTLKPYSAEIQLENSSITPHPIRVVGMYEVVPVPIYEYACQNCGHNLEKLQKMSDAPLTDCPECGEASLTKQVSAGGFRLKGGGWYETDFKSGSKKNVAKADKKPAASKSSDKKTG